MDIKSTDNEYIAPTYARFPVEFATGKGSLLFDNDGKRYIDFGSGIAVNTFGVSDEEWKAAVKNQLDKLQHTSNLYYTEPCARLAELLCKRTGMKKVFFSNSGAEANECAIKAARRLAFLKYGEGHHYIITLKNSFHGRTITTLAATGQDAFHTEFGPFTDGFLYADPADPESLERLAQDYPVCAVMVEFIQGEGGVNPLSAQLVEKIKEVAAKKNLLVIADEVQTGNGRTGTLYAYEQFGITPDIISTAKGLAGGLPLGATMLGEKAENAFAYGTHGSTFGGNPIAAAGAVNILSRIDGACLEGVRLRSEIIRKALEGAKGVKSVAGLGLMLGIECERPAKEIANECLEKGLLVLTAKNKIRLLPALNIPEKLLGEGLDILKEVLI